jgi:hypothetical protein
VSASRTSRAAQWYGQGGFPVFPLHCAEGGRCSCGRGDCQAPGKHPRISNWPGQATTALSVIQDWWSRWPEANVGLVTGRPSGIVVLDIDPRHDGHLTLGELESRFGELPATIEAQTGGGGRHLVFKHPGGRLPNSAGLLGPGLDVRGDGGYIVAPPSIHVSGRSYEWDTERHPARVVPASLPQWLLDKLAQSRKRVVESFCYSPLSSLAMDGVREGQRNVSLTRLAGHLLRHRVDPQISLGLLRSWNQVSCHPPLLEDEMLRTIESIAGVERRRRRGC